MSLSLYLKSFGYIKEVKFSNFNEHGLHRFTFDFLVPHWWTLLGRIWRCTLVGEVYH